MTGGAAPKRKGAEFERDVVTYLVANGHAYAERAYGAGRPDDRGDIDGLPGWIIQCRATRAFDLAGALTAAERQCPDHLHYPAAIIKRPRHPVGQAYVVISLETFAAIAAGTP